jgi:hypothetical protein
MAVENIRVSGSIPWPFAQEEIKCNLDWLEMANDEKTDISR